ncbi:penicillin-binding transpeptidase domain-containing protein [Clostridium ganghwense]|uniref:Penicillin-binding transpeptidase domain-containing protein n=1 Tax=Clostridium ganghwense TaxID=312089 RepID=A0ABT4CNW2_9CLOT|nr:penicillin-binding transpeptidase domain-containing protein [Clostridium ganghwense]MCY6370747.1 penicillin-binding transpeptidase domain-containing protein [Clostridium ganghwense]
MSKFSMSEAQKRYKKKKDKKKYNRYTALVMIMFLIFSLIICRLVNLQIVKGEEYRERTSKKSIRNIPIAPPRGNIIDSKGKILAESRQGYTLVFTETDESKKKFFDTMIKVFEILDKNGESQRDDFELKINPFRFEFGSDNPKTRRWMELRFKKDRGMNDEVRKDLFPGKKSEELTEEEKKKIDEKLLKITPEETFNYLLHFYKIDAQENKLIYTDLFNKMKGKEVKGTETLEHYLNLHKIEVKNKEDEKIFAELYKKMPKEIFDYLVGLYNVKKDRYSLQLKRRLMLVKDAMKMQSFYGFKPVVIASNLKKNTAFIYMQKYEELPGIEVTVDPIRVYPNKELGSAFLGYLSKISSYNQEKYEEKGYDASTDYIGAAGIESAFESTLRGSKGTKIVQINKHGRIMKELGRKEPYPGKSVQLTVDSEIQYTAEMAFDQVMKNLQASGRNDDVDTTNATRGAVTAIDVKTGKVLALVSKPGYDPNLFAVPGRLTSELQSQYFNPDLKSFGAEYAKNLLKRNGIAREAYKNKTVDDIVDRLFPLDKSIKNNTTIRQDRYDIYPKPLYNYATKSLIPPGSTFKPLVGLAGLEEGVLQPNETIYDGIVYTKHGYKGRDWNSYSFGKVNVAKAIEKSINYFFFEVGDRLFQTKKYNGGFDAIAHYAWKFGLGAPSGVKPATGIEIPERFGQVYNLESGRRIFSSLYMNSLINLLQRGTDTRTPNYNSHYIGVDITDNENDSDKIKKLKEKLRSRILEEMKYRAKGTADIKSMFLELSDLDPKLKKKYTDNYNEYSKNYVGNANKKMTYEAYVADQVEQAWLAAVYSIDDANFNINNQNNVYDASIGQGTNQFTPLQLANYIATLVNGGNRYKVHLVDKILDQDGKVVKEYKPELIEKINLKDVNVNAVKAGMKDVTGGDGTARTAFEGFPISNGGKTGSATFAKVQDEFGRTSYGVYVGFAPFDNPEIAVCAVVFDGGHGGFVAPVARAIYEKYFEERLKKDYPDYVPRYNFTIQNDIDQEKTESSVDINVER